MVQVGGQRGDGGDEAQVEEQLEPAGVPFLLRVGVMAIVGRKLDE